MSEQQQPQQVMDVSAIDSDLLPQLPPPQPPSTFNDENVDHQEEEKVVNFVSSNVKNHQVEEENLPLQLGLMHLPPSVVISDHSQDQVVIICCFCDHHHRQDPSPPSLYDNNNQQMQSNYVIT